MCQVERQSEPARFLLEWLLGIPRKVFYFNELHHKMKNTPETKHAGTIYNSYTSQEAL